MPGRCEGAFRAGDGAAAIPCQTGRCGGPPRARPTEAAGTRSPTGETRGPFVDSDCGAVKGTFTAPDTAETTRLEVATQVEMPVRPNTTVPPEVATEADAAVRPEATAQVKMLARPNTTAPPEVATAADNAARPETTAQVKMLVRPEMAPQLEVATLRQATARRAATAELAARAARRKPRDSESMKGPFTDLLAEPATAAAIEPTTAPPGRPRGAPPVNQPPAAPANRPPGAPAAAPANRTCTEPTSQEGRMITEPPPIRSGAFRRHTG